MLLAVAADAIGKLLRRAILAFGQPAGHSNPDLPPEFFKFPFC
jgi:hypothetical protein